MARRPKTWEDIGNVKRRQAGRSAQMAADAAWRAAHSQVTVPDGATLDSLAQQNGTTPEDLLAANPNVNNIKTGMVLTVPGNRTNLEYSSSLGPRPGSEAWRVNNVGGLPSNAALGGATTNPVGWNGDMGRTPRTTPPTPPTNPYLRIQQGYPVAPSPAMQAIGGLFNSDFANLRNSPQLWNPITTGVLGGIGGIVNNATQQAIGSTQPVSSVQNTSTPASMSAARIAKQAKDDFYPLEILSLQQSPTYTPSPAQVSYLERMGYIQKAPTAPTMSSGGGGRGRGRGRGGGGGGRGGGTPARVPASPVERPPAFSSGAGFGGLINWRI